MGDDLNFQLEGMQVFLGGQEIKGMKEITVPSDVKIEMEEIVRSPLRVMEPPKGVLCEVELHPVHRSRWRMIEKAYRLMGTTALHELTWGRIREARTKDGALLVRMGGSMGKSAATLNIIGPVGNTTGELEIEMKI